MPHELEQLAKRRVLEMAGLGMSRSVIADRVGIARSTVSRWIKAEGITELPLHRKDLGVSVHGILGVSTKRRGRHGRRGHQVSDADVEKAEARAEEDEALKVRWREANRRRRRASSLSPEECRLVWIKRCHERVKLRKALGEAPHLGGLPWKK